MTVTSTKVEAAESTVTLPIPETEQQLKEFPSTSAGLRYKVLTLPPKLPLDRNGLEDTTSNTAYSEQGGTYN